jgi:hypothetical protein
MKYITTLRFMLNLLSDKVRPLQVDAITLTDQSGFSVPADIYQPRQPDKYQGTIIFFHGMNKQGNKDPRMVALYRAAARVNYRAIAPDYELLKNHFVDAASTHEFAETVKAVTSDPALAPTGKVGIFTASFSGTFCVHAVTRDDVRDLVSSLCSVGICYNPTSTFTNILNGEGADNYSRFICMKNLLYVAGELDPISDKALSLGIDDNFDDFKTTQFEDYIQTIEDEEKRTSLAELGAAIYASKDLAKPYARHIQIMQDTYGLSEGLQNIRCNVALVHSETDDVLHTVESEMLYKQLKQYNIDVKLVITPLLEHADIQFRLKYLLDVLHLVNVFHCFFDHVSFVESEGEVKFQHPVT